MIKPAAKSAGVAPVALPNTMKLGAATPLEVALFPSHSKALDLPAIQIMPIQIMPTQGNSNGLTASSNSSDRDDAVRLERVRQFITAMCVDLSGNLWIGTEGDGIQRFEPSAARLHEWTQFTTNDGLGDNNAYALVCDHSGRLWVGHLNHGVSVFNGQKWQNYDVVGGVNRPDSLSGPLGERVFAITVCPTDGDVWIATNAGLTRYSASKDQWTYYTRANGLPSDQANAIAFDSEGNIYVATQCDGITMADAQDGYAIWRQVRGLSRLPRVPFGQGLPTNLINDVLVARDGTVYTATVAGLAWSLDRGKSWQFVRGADWADKVRNSAHPPSAGWTPRPGAFLAEDYIVRLAQDRQGALYVGYRKRGWEKFILRPAGTLTAAGFGPGDFIDAMPPVIDRYHLAGSYGMGLIALGEGALQTQGALSPRASQAVKLPSGAKPPTFAELNQTLHDLTEIPPLLMDDAPKVISLEDDCRTEGDWLGRYGRYWAVLPAIDAYDYYVWGAGPEHIDFFRGFGAHHDKGDGVRGWIGQLYTDDTRILEMPPVYADSRIKHGYVTATSANRRLGQWDDHGEAYSDTYEGPDLYCTLRIPSGRFTLAIYQVNADGHEGHGAPNRDFAMEIKEHGPSLLSDISDFDARPDLATTRVLNFYYGVYKRFLVEGPAELTIKVCRQYSLNANISGLMLDLPDERPVPYFMSVDQWHNLQAARERETAVFMQKWQSNHRFMDAPAAESDDEAAKRLSQMLLRLQDWNPEWWAIHRRQLAALLARWCEAKLSDNSLPLEELSLKGECFYEADMYSDWESCLSAQGVTSARQIEKSLRWDGVTPAYSGHGYETVTAYLASLHSRR
jgi:sugar lactone lactonase YvrE